MCVFHWLVRMIIADLTVTERVGNFLLNLLLHFLWDFFLT